MKKNTLSQLKESLRNSGAGDVRGTLAKIQDRCCQQGLPIEKEVPKCKEGWLGKPKGMLQILWEWGHIDPFKTKNGYTVKGKKNVYGNIIPEMSLCMLMSSLLDFTEEETLLQYHG